MRVYIGYDPRDEMALRACVSSLRKHSTIELDIIPLKECDLRRKGVFNRPYAVTTSGQFIDLVDGKPFSTQFSFTRFCIPLIDNSDEWVMFVDADFLFFADIAELVALIDDSKKLMCVKHDYNPENGVKFDGMRQEGYNRKNWSSLMLMNPSKIPLSQADIDSKSGSWLHGMSYLSDSEIGGLPEGWNTLDGWSTCEPKAYHYTLGTPDLIGERPFNDVWWNAVKEWTPDMNRAGI